MDENRLYRDLAVHPCGPEHMALLEGVELSGPEYVAPSPEPSTHCTKARQACVRPAATTELHSGSQVMFVSCCPVLHLFGLLHLL